MVSLVFFGFSNFRKTQNITFCFWKTKQNMNTSLLPRRQQVCYMTLQVHYTNRTQTCVQSGSPRRWCSHQYLGSGPRCVVFLWFWFPHTHMHPDRSPAAGCTAGWRGLHSLPGDGKQWVQLLSGVWNVETISSTASWVFRVLSTLVKANTPIKPLVLATLLLNDIHSLHGVIDFGDPLHFPLAIPASQKFPVKYLQDGLA